MAPRKTKKLQVRLTWDQWKRLKRAARLESDARHEDVAAGTLLRELGFPKVDERLRELEIPPVRSDVPRRSGDDRRTPAVSGAR